MANNNNNNNNKNNNNNSAMPYDKHFSIGTQISVPAFSAVALMAGRVSLINVQTLYLSRN